MQARSLLGRVLQDPQSALALDARGWELLVTQARGAALIARLHSRLEAKGLLGRVPEAPRWHLEAADFLARRHAESARSEASKVLGALRDLGSPVIFLKGAGYLLAEMPVARGRLFGDIDILVPKSFLPNTESCLMVAGWVSTHRNPYDQRYYRRWMHELPPLEHTSRGTSVDVHHTLFPLTGRLRLDIRPVLQGAVPLPGWPGAQVLSAHDQILHAAIHLFFGEEFTHGLRDLSDLDMLLRAGSQQEHFWQNLSLRAEALGLQRPLYYAVYQCQRQLATPIPERVMSALGVHAPSAPVRALMDALFDRVLAPPDVDDRGQALAKFALFVRGHWLKMPVHLLAYHLGRKMLMADPEQAKVTEKAR